MTTPPLTEFEAVALEHLLLRYSTLEIFSHMADGYQAIADATKDKQTKEGATGAAMNMRQLVEVNVKAMEGKK